MPEESEDLGGEDVTPLTFEELGDAFSQISDYSDMDRYRDFREVFLGSPEGRRVLYAILALCRMFKTSVPLKVERDSIIWVNEGRRDIALQIMSILKKQPPALGRPTKTKGVSNG